MRFLKKLFLYSFLLAALGAVVVLGGYWYFSQGLPSPDELKRWRPPQATKVYCRDGSVCGEFFVRRSTWVPSASLPAYVRNAFIAAEDSEFYRHHGVDYVAMGRAALRALRPGARLAGASTISQQLCRNLLLTTERSVSRKIREIILTPRMEKALTKDEILDLYLNYVDFGLGRYGIEEASQYYFGKPAVKLTLGEAAALAGTVQRPRDNPLSNAARTKVRKEYVLAQMVRNGYATEEAAASEKARPLVLGPRPKPFVGGYYLEEVRRRLVETYGNTRVLEGGLRVYTMMDAARQEAAEAALRAGLEELDQRLGYRGPIGHIDLPRFEALRPLLLERLQAAGRRRGEERVIGDLANLVADEANPEDVDPDESKSADQRLAEKLAVKPLAAGLEVAAIITKVDSRRNSATIDLVSTTATVDINKLRWASRETGQKETGPKALAVGDVVRLRIGPELPPKGPLPAILAQEPVVQGALISIDPNDRGVTAMVGGYDFAKSSFNRATQALRQPGSAFKPILYAAALETRKFTAASVVNDAPEAIRDSTTGVTWKPHNYESDRFDGPMRLRSALARSKNTVSVRLIDAIGPPAVIDMARRLGITSDLPSNLTLALGTGEVRVLELANAFTTFASLGVYSEPILISRVLDPQGAVLEEHLPNPVEAISAPLAYIVTSLLKGVVEEGTAMLVRNLGRPAAGKTGTTQEYRDAWFAGYTSTDVAVAWVGYDGHEPLGPGETGAKAALPVWLNYMSAISKPGVGGDFPVPEGVVEVRIDPATGQLAGQSMPGTNEYFLDGTAPTEATSTVDPNDFLLHEER